MIGSIFVSASGSNLGTSTEKTNVLTSSQDIISVNIPVGSYEIKQVAGYDEISIENFGRLLTPGKPNLPSKIFAIGIPPGAEITKVTFNTNEEVVLPGTYNVTPASLPRVIGQEKPDIYERELQVYEENYKTVYSNDEPYPALTVELVRTAGFRKYNLVDVRVTPFTYYPLSGKLVYHPNIKVHVSYTIPEGFSPEEIMIDNIESFEQRASEFILNYDQTVDWYPTGPTGRETYDYVIITLDSLITSVEPLVVWEEAKGKSVNVVTTSWINSEYSGYDPAEKIRNFLRDKYPEDEWGIEYVCLIGHYDDVMIRRTAQSTGYGQPETDFYHAELSYPDDQSWDADGDHQYCDDTDPIDYYAEVYVGRIPWSDPSTVESICEKTAAYESTDDPAFKKNILLLGAYFWADTDNAVLMEEKVDQDWMSDWTMTRMYEQGYSTYPSDYNLDYNTVKSVWSAGSYAFVNYAGHGSPTSCHVMYSKGSAFVDTDTCNYLNDDYPAIVFADACSNSDTDDDNIGQMMLEQGAVGFLGATKVAYGMHAWNNPYSGSSQSLDYFFTIGCTEGVLTQGQSQQYALQEMYENNLWYYQKYEHCQWGALWGNPDLTMGEVVTSDPPANPEKPTGPNEGAKFEECTFQTSTTDPNGDQIYYIFDWGNGEFTDWLGPYNSGQTVEASYAWSEIGDYEIKVEAKDEFGAKSDWSEPLTISIVENTPPIKPTITGRTWGFGGLEYEYTFVSTDDDGHDIYYRIDWDDRTNTSWLGPYNSGEEIALSHSWDKKGTYWIKAWAKDTIEGESSQASFKVEILTNKNQITIQSSPLFNMILSYRFLSN